MYNNNKDNLDIKLIEKAKLGDEKSREYLISKYSFFIEKKLRTFYLVGGDKDDMFQEGLIGLNDAIDSYNKNKNCKFSSFANICIKRKMITAIKASKRQKHIPLNNYASVDTPIYQDSTSTLLDVIEDSKVCDPCEIYICKENINEIEDIIKNKLSDIEKDVMKLHIIGNTYLEISHILGIDNKSVDNALQRGKKKIIKYKRK